MEEGTGSSVYLKCGAVCECLQKKDFNLGAWCRYSVRLTDSVPLSTVSFP